MRFDWRCKEFTRERGETTESLRERVSNFLNTEELEPCDVQMQEVHGFQQVECIIVWYELGEPETDDEELDLIARLAPDESFTRVRMTLYFSPEVYRRIQDARIMNDISDDGEVVREALREYLKGVESLD